MLQYICPYGLEGTQFTVTRRHQSGEYYRLFFFLPRLWVVFARESSDPYRNFQTLLGVFLLVPIFQHQDFVQEISVSVIFLCPLRTRTRIEGPKLGQWGWLRFLLWIIFQILTCCDACDSRKLSGGNLATPFWTFGQGDKVR